MLRELSLTLLDLQEGFQRMATQAGRGDTRLRLTGVELALPVDLRMAFVDGGCRLFGDLPRSRAETGFAVSPSRLAIVWEQRPLRDVLGEGP